MGRYRPPTPKGSNYITSAGEKALRHELQQLWNTERPKVTEAVHEAAKNGDRSENGDYIYGKKRLREIDSRIRYLTKRLDQVIVVDKAPTNRDQIYFGAWVTLKNDAGETLTYHIVGCDEFDLKQRKLSVDSPLAKALMHKRCDDEITVQTPSGLDCYLILSVNYE